MKLSKLKPLYAIWIGELYDHLRKQNETIVKGMDDQSHSICQWHLRHLRREDKWKHEFLAFVIDFIVLTLKHTIHQKMIAVLLRYVCPPPLLTPVWNHFPCFEILKSGKDFRKKVFKVFSFKMFGWPILKENPKNSTFCAHKSRNFGLFNATKHLHDMRENYAKTS